MEEMDIRTLSEGKYAIQRKNVLKDHFPAAYRVCRWMELLRSILHIRRKA